VAFDQDYRPVPVRHEAHAPAPAQSAEDVPVLEGERVRC
jgi:hypothetical protein